MMGFSVIALLQNVLVSLLVKEILKSVNIWQSYTHKVDCFTCSVRTASVQKSSWKMNSSDIEHDRQQLLLTAVRLILTWRRQLSNWCWPMLTCWHTPPATGWTLMIACKEILLRRHSSLLWQVVRLRHDRGSNFQNPTQPNHRKST